MQVKSFVFLSVFLLVSVFVLPSFPAATTNSGSGSMQNPTIKFKSWQVGRSTGHNADNREHRSFITSTETTCQVLASVGYNGNQPRNTAPIDPKTVRWEFIEFSRHLSLPDNAMTHNWSDSHPSRLSGTTSFNVLATLTVAQHQRTSTPNICRDENDHLRHQRTPTHRGNTRLSFKIKFTAQTVQGSTVTETLHLEQDEKDQLRQEYLDMNRKVPARDDGKWADQNTYDFGHYTMMLDGALQNKHDAWATAINTRERQNKGLPDLTRDDLELNSGYRNPHHNKYYSGGAAVHGLHQYGLALDVAGINVDNQPGTERREKHVESPFFSPPFYGRIDFQFNRSNGLRSILWQTCYEAKTGENL